MTTPLNLWTGNLPGVVLMEGGVILIGASVFSAQEGGLKFVAGSTKRHVAFDGMRSEVVGLHRTVEFKPVISGTILELPSTAFADLEPGATAVTITGGPTSATQMQPKTAGVLYASGDYLANVKAVWQRGDGTIFQLRFPKAHCIKWDLAGKDKEEGKFSIELQADLDMSVSGNTLSTPPYVLEYAAALT